MLQLLSGTALFVATKLEGVLPHPGASALVRLSDDTFDLDELVRFERSLVQTLGFNLYGPTPYNFLRAFEDALPGAGSDLEAHVRSHVHHLASYILELASCQYDMLRRDRSVVAAAALILAYTDRGLLRTCARAADLSSERLEQYAHQVVAAMRARLGPAIDVHDLSLTIAELLRAVRAVAESSVKPYVFQKYAKAAHWGVTLMSDPLTTNEMCSVLRTLFYSV
jgi:hypothetical protein